MDWLAAKETVDSSKISEQKKSEMLPPRATDGPTNHFTLDKRRMHYGPDQSRTRRKYWATCSSIYLFTHNARCAHSLAHLFTHWIPSSWESKRWNAGISCCSLPWKKDEKDEKDEKRSFQKNEWEIQNGQNFLDKLQNELRTHRPDLSAGSRAYISNCEGKNP